MTGGRYERLEQIEWWDGPRVRGARALVAGAGALGNELVKNLLLLGWGTIVVADFDTVEESNLSRSVLFTASDVGQPKAEVIARNAGRVNPEPTVIALAADVRTSVSSGLLSRMDVVFGCLDNVTARVAVGQLAGRAGRLFIDGGLTIWEGAVRLFHPPGGPCYACGLSQDDLNDLALRRSCVAYAARSEQSDGVPTTPAIASLTSAVMAQQALKWIHRDQHDLAISVDCELRFDTAYDRFWKISIPRNADCIIHPEAAELANAPTLFWDDSWASALTSIRAELGCHELELRLPLQVLERWTCPECGAAAEEPAVRPGHLAIDCPKCGHAVIADLTNVVLGDEPWAALSPRQMSFPPWSWVEADADGAVHILELTGNTPELDTLKGPGRS